MAFTAKYLRPLGDNVTSSVSPVVWTYYNAAGDTLTAAGFIPANYGVKAGDKILAIGATASALPVWYYASVSSGVITLGACS